MMKHTVLSLVFALFAVSCTQLPQATEPKVEGVEDVGIDVENAIEVTMQLQTVNNDQVNVMVNPTVLSGTVVYDFPKTVPGTYSVDNYGRLIEAFKAYDYDGNEISFTKDGENTYVIEDGAQLDYVTYLVNDSYDIVGELDIFSPSGTNIKENENFVLNLHGFIGYFNGNTEVPYLLQIEAPSDLYTSTAMMQIDQDQVVNQADTVTNFAFYADRYFAVTDNPIFFSKTEPASFMVDDMKIVLDVYSPNNVYTAQQLLPNIQKMVTAQKNYLGDINNTDLYVIQLYLSEMDNDASGYGALEHHTSTVVVLPEMMPKEALNESMTDVVSHEFFHTLTPLNVHSEEIQFFDYADPKMSQHLWMYEGVTEYFANHFQVHENLISATDFLTRMSEKISNSKSYNDHLPFTEMSKNVLQPAYEKEYINVYEKGALIAMALDIRLRELSNGERGLLNLMSELSARYGNEKPFKDDELIQEIVELTYPEIQTFFDTYVTGTTSIPYDEFFKKVGVVKEQTEVESSLLLLDMSTPYIDVNDEKNIYFRERIEYNSMLQKLGVKANDILLSLNGVEYNLETIQGLVMATFMLKEGDKVSLTINRDGDELTLTETYETPMATKLTLVEQELPVDDSRVKLRNAWLYSK